MSTLKHNCKAHSKAKSKYYFSFESPIKACGLKAWNYVASDRKTTRATFRPIFFFFKKLFMLRCNLYIIKFIHFKCTGR